MQIVLLSGGAGKRLWPLSNDLYSKQFLRLFKCEDGTRESMIQRVVRQVQSAVPDVSITIATAREQMSLIRRQLGNQVNISIEPCRRDTFPAIALVSSYLHDKCDVSYDEPIAICPADPYVDEDYFLAIKRLLTSIERGTSASLLLMGIEPTYPSEKYGYILPTARMEQSPVHAFKEKPNEELAARYIENGALWNSGVFVFRLGYALDKSRQLLGSASYEEILHSYADLPKISFDYAVVEKEDSIAVQRYSGTWLDVGTWNTLSEVMSEYSIGRVTMDEACSNVHVVNTLSVPVLCMGMKDAIVAASPEGILVADKDRSSAMKPYVENLHTPVMYAEKSWGEFRIIDTEPKSLTIKITLTRGESLTYHKHEYRDETWTVIEGRGWVKLDGHEFAVAEGQTVRIPRGSFHTIRAETLLKVMEVQVGEDIDVEDKIVWDNQESNGGITIRNHSFDLPEPDKKMLPHLEERIAYINEHNISFAHYTSASTAIEIIKNGEIWMRSAIDMNDLREVEFGYETVFDLLKEDDVQSKFDEYLKHFDMRAKKLFAQEWQSFLEMKKDVFISCMSEHDDREYPTGRLSMWRAYAPAEGVALIMRPDIMRPDVLNGVFFGGIPVSYVKPFEKEKTRAVLKNMALSLGEFRHEEIKSRLLGSIYALATSIKNPSFEEEREWRFVLSSSITVSPCIKEKKDYIQRSIVSINGLPQQVYKLQLDKAFAEQVGDVKHPFVNKFLKEIIIGPSRNSILLKEALCDVLESKGVSDPCNMVKISDIPLRL